MKFHENLSIGSQADTYEWTDWHEASRHFHGLFEYA
jgi:hypothetical protein